MPKGLMAITKAVILAAGEGTRMHPLTYTRPKVMLPVANKPILEHLLFEMKLAGISEFIIIVGYHDEQIRNYFGTGAKWGVNIQYRNQRKQMGTSDALLTVEDLINEGFLLANGDNIIDHQDIKSLIGRTGNVLSVIELKDVTGLGVIEVNGDRITRLFEKTEKPPSHLANAGLYLFTPGIFKATKMTAKSPRGEYELPDSIQIMIHSGQAVNYQIISRWQDFSYPWDLLAANEKIMSTLETLKLGEIETNVVIKGIVSVGKGTIIKSGSYIVGPVIIGENCDIGPNCYIRPSTAIADNCHIGAGVEIKNSIVMAGSKIPHLSYVGDSIIGENCNLGAGTKIANLRLDKQKISIGEIDTKRRKLGAILGDRIETGINASINVGAMIGNNSFIGPGALAHGVISPNSKIF
jgi:UDP-N-acetylglucosamine diphosphorylase/glucosamine-1-phosphate N-acetyltransferase